MNLNSFFAISNKPWIHVKDVVVFQEKLFACEDVSAISQSSHETCIEEMLHVYHLTHEGIFISNRCQT